MSKLSTGPKILFLDIETSPIISYTWGLFDQNIGLNQIKSDWHLLSFAAKWAGEADSKVIYADQSKAKNIENDKPLLEMLWKLMDEADIIIGQNSKRFDVKKINARFLMHGMKPPSPYKQIDTLVIMKRHFALTSNKLEFASNALCKKYKKLKHAKFSGFELWKACLAGNKEAWAEMKKYNVHDTLATEELYNILASWDNSINFNLYRETNRTACNCGSKSFQSRGYAFTNTGKYQRFTCTKCGTWSRGAMNLLSKEETQALKRKIT